MSTADDLVDAFDELTQEHQGEIIGTAKLGYISDDVEYGGFTFGLRTLYIEEELAAAVAVKPYRDTMREPHAWATAVVAASLTHINGDKDFCPEISHDTLENIKSRVRWVMSKRFQFSTIEFLYTQTARLAQEQAGIIERVETLSDAGQTGFTDLEGFLEGQDLFNDKSSAPQ